MIIVTGLLIIMMAIFVLPLMFLGPLLAPIGILLSVVFGVAGLVLTALVAAIQGGGKDRHRGGVRSA